jgi:hypothetical protein
MDKPTDPRRRAAGFAGRLLLLAAFVGLTFPYLLVPPTGGIDGSWLIGLNTAFQHHRIWGREIAFTYGPLGFVMYPLDLGSNFLHAVAFRVGLNLLWWISIGVLLFRMRSRTSMLLFTAGALCSGAQFQPTGDCSFGLTGVIVLTTIGYLVLAYLDRRPVWAMPAMLVSAVALLAKFNLGIACIVSIGVWAILELMRDRRRSRLWWLCLLAFTYLVALLTLFRIYGGPIDALVDFVRFSLAIGSGFSSQMSGLRPAPGASETVIIAGMILALVVTGAGVLLRRPFAPIALVVLFPFFALFKGAIVRADFGHFEMSCPPMVGVAAFLLAGCNGRRQARVIQAFVMILLGGCLWLIPPTPASVLMKGIHSGEQLWRQAEFRRALSGVTMKPKYTLPPMMLEMIGRATVDVYPHMSCYAFYNDLNWRPRLVFQSYAAYNPNLDRKCADLYAGPNAPQFIIYKHESIDTEHPCIVDPLTWLELARWYDLAARSGDVLLLRHRQTPRWEEARRLGHRWLAFGERWEVPHGVRGPVILRAQPELNTLGKLSDLVYKVYAPRLRVEYEDGTTAKHLLVWRNIRSGFLVSDLPNDVSRVPLFLDQGKADRVRAVTFLDDHGFFRKAFRVSWSEVPFEATASRSVPQPVVPVSLHQMTWDRQTGRSTGDDGFAVFAMEKPAFVKSITVRYSLEHPAPQVPMTVFWLSKERNGVATPERSSTTRVPTGKDRTVTLSIFDRMDGYRLDLKTSSFTWKFSEIALQVPVDATGITSSADRTRR